MPRLEIPPLDQRESADRNIGFLLHDVARLMRTDYDRKMRQLGLTRSQWWVLTYLYFNEGITQTELSGLLEVERATLGRLLDRLAEKGWVERRADPDDRRVKRVYLTGEVEALMGTMRVKAAEVRGQAFDGVGQEEQERLISMLVHIKENLLSPSNGAGEGGEKRKGGGHG